jgi:hypothetical protein
MSQQEVAKVVRYFIVQLSALNNTISKASGVSVQVSANRGQITENGHLTPDT